MVYICDVCGEQFSKEWSLDRHVKHFHKLNFLCNLCGFQTDDKQTSTIHKKLHTQQYFQCEHCNKKIKTNSAFRYGGTRSRDRQRGKGPHTP